MKTIIKNFLFKKRFKILKSKKGFSLLEVLVAVAIIGIISAIAVPSYKANRKAAAQAAGTTSLTNIERAYQNCLVLNTFGNCNTLAEIGVECPDCTESTDNTNKFCVQLVKSSGGQDMKACISFNTSNDSRIKTLGGGLMTGNKICQEQTSIASTPPGSFIWPTTGWSTMTSPMKNCKTKTDCGTDHTGPLTATGHKKYHCDVASQQGVCASHECT